MIIDYELKFREDTAMAKLTAYIHNRILTKFKQE